MLSGPSTHNIASADEVPPNPKMQYAAGDVGTGFFASRYQEVAMCLTPGAATNPVIFRAPVRILKIKFYGFIAINEAVAETEVGHHVYEYHLVATGNRISQMSWNVNRGYDHDTSILCAGMISTATDRNSAAEITNTRRYCGFTEEMDNLNLVLHPKQESSAAPNSAPYHLVFAVHRVIPTIELVEHFVYWRVLITYEYA